MAAHADDTIAALSTPPGEAGIAVVRVSGSDAVPIVAKFFRDPAGGLPDALEHRRLYHGRMVSTKGDTVDEVVLAVFRAPQSYTGEDVIEISCHGGPVTVSRVLDTLYASGARPAEPGEFTKRAFLAGKMDLIQAEAVADLIHARSELQQRAAQRQLEGGLSREIGTLADATLTLLADLEANIDFLEDDTEHVDYPAAIELAGQQVAAIDALLESAPLTRPFRDGYQVVIAGPVNAGKSSLFNRLAQAPRAIVTEIPGTTRDVLREPVLLGGLLFVFSDTAGLRDPGGDRVEEIGMNLAADAVRDADLVVFVVDRSADLPPGLLERAATLEPARTLVAMNKCDLPAAPGAAALRDALADTPLVEVSAQTGEGVDDLRRRLVQLVGGETLSRMARERFVLNHRLVSLMREAREAAATLRESLVERKPLELLAAEAREVLTRYEEATGRRYHEGLLDTIFSRFCLGK